LIIAMGEFLLVTGNTISRIEWNPAAVTAFISAFVTTVAMWWLYFSVSAERASHVIEHSDNRGQLGRLAYTYVHLLLVIAIVLVAVADEFVLAHPLGHTSIGTGVAMIGGVALYLAANILFKRLMFKDYPLSHVIGLALLAILAIAAAYIPPVAVAASASTILVIVAVKETITVMRN